MAEVNVEDLTVPEEFATQARKRKWLVCVDGSVSSRRALFHALSLMDPKRDRLLLLNICKSKEDPNVQMYMDYFVRLVDQWPMGKVRYKQKVVESKRAKEEICTQIENEVADFCVMGSRGLTGVKKVMMGSVSSYVSSHAMCPVLVVPLPIEESEQVRKATEEKGGKKHHIPLMKRSKKAGEEEKKPMKKRKKKGKKAAPEQPAKETTTAPQAEEEGKKAKKAEGAVAEEQAKPQGITAAQEEAEKPAIAEHDEARKMEGERPESAGEAKPTITVTEYGEEKKKQQEPSSAAKDTGGEEQMAKEESGTTQGAKISEMKEESRKKKKKKKKPKTSPAVTTGSE